MNGCESAPWADIMNEEENGHGGGEGAPSETWTVFDWDNYDARCILHAHIMVLYELIGYTRVAMCRRGNAQLGDEVIGLLQRTLDDMTALRNNRLMERMF